VIVCVHYLSKAGWSTALRRIPEAMAAAVPLGIVLTLGLMLGLRTLYPWARPLKDAGDPVLLAKSGFLNIPFFILRSILYFAVWSYLSRAIIRHSREQDASGDMAFTRENIRLSVVFLIVFALTFSLASIDWLMSLEPDWYSTIYPWYLFSGTFANGLAVMTVAAIVMRRRGILPQINSSHLQDLGRYIFAFSCFWAYLWFSQYLLIWYSNIPEETKHYMARLRPGWNLLFWANPVINFLVPFFVLLPAKQKRTERVLIWVCLLLIAGHWLDLYLQAAPDVLEGRPHIGWIELGLFFGSASAFILLFDRAFQSAPPMPIRDPYLEESLQYHG
jgi:hypothetical protein